MKVVITVFGCLVVVAALVQASGVATGGLRYRTEGRTVAVADAWSDKPVSGANVVAVWKTYQTILPIEGERDAGVVRVEEGITSASGDVSFIRKDLGLRPFWIQVGQRGSRNSPQLVVRRRGMSTLGVWKERFLVKTPIPNRKEDLDEFVTGIERDCSVLESLEVSRGAVPQYVASLTADVRSAFAQGRRCSCPWLDGD